MSLEKSIKHICDSAPEIVTCLTTNLLIHSYSYVDLENFNPRRTLKYIMSGAPYTKDNHFPDASKMVYNAPEGDSNLT